MNKVFTLILTLSFFIGNSQNTIPDFLYVKTTDSLPFLKYGIGENRLGGAKMTYLDSNIVLKIAHSFKTDYKVQLSQLHSAWIEKSNVTKTQFINSAKHLTDDWKVWGDSLFDYVTIQLDEKLPYTSKMEIDPSKIVVDIFGATSNTNWIEQLSSVKEIKNAWYEQTEDDVMRVFIELNHQQHWGYSIFYNDSSKLTIRVKRQPPSLRLKDITIAIDAGHGGTNIGTTGSKNNIMEKDYTLIIAKDLENDLLQKKSKIIMKSVLKKGLHEFGNVGSFNFALNGPTDYLNCLVEVAFLSNKGDEKRILNGEFRIQVAKKIVEGIENFLKNL
jgi:N-acetylmuramoyl-L-alanine amidase